MQTWLNRQYSEIEAQANTLYPNYFFNIWDDNESVNSDQKRIAIRVTQIESLDEHEITLVGGVQNKDILLLLSKYMAQRVVIPEPLPFDEMPKPPIFIGDMSDNEVKRLQAELLKMFPSRR